jgi:tetratricopeptide (TPR) repeat protein
MAGKQLAVWISIGLAFVVIAAHVRLVNCDFINLDDAEYVTTNPAVASGLSWQGVNWAFTHSVAGNWHPVTILSHMLDCQIFGVRPGPAHVMNLLLHVLNTVLLFLVLLSLTRTTAVPEGNVIRRAQSATSHAMDTAPIRVWLCAFAAALFGVHPLHVESVAWISERKDVLSGLFFMLTLLSYSAYVCSAGSSGAPKKPRGISGVFYTLAVLAFALGLMSKPMLVTLPFVLLLLDLWPLRRIATTKGVLNRAAVRECLPLLWEKVPFFALAAMCCFVTFRMQRASGAVVTLDNFSLNDRISNSLVSCVTYLSKTFWPCSLAIIYPWNPKPPSQVVLCAVLLIAISIYAIASLKTNTHIFVGWFLFIGMLVPAIGIVQVGSQAMADRYTYLPLTGVFIALAWSLPSFISRRQRAAAVLPACAVLALAAATFHQTGFWRDSEILFSHALAATEHNSQAHYMLGAIYEARGDSNNALGRFEAAVQENPANVRAHCGLGYIYGSQGRFSEAVQHYQAALLIQPANPKAHVGLADVLLRQNKIEDAIEHYSLALKAQPGIAEAHYQLAGLLEAKQDRAGAASHLRRAVELAPDWPLPINNLAWALATWPETSLRNGDEALRLARRAVSLTDGGNPGALDTLAAAYAETGQFADAVQTAGEAIQKATSYGQTNLAIEITSRLRRYEARQAYRE